MPLVTQLPIALKDEVLKTSLALRVKFAEGATVANDQTVPTLVLIPAISSTRQNQVKPAASDGVKFVTVNIP
jgi:hypothetical protein